MSNYPLLEAFALQRRLTQSPVHPSNHWPLRQGTGLARVPPVQKVIPFHGAGPGRALQGNRKEKQKQNAYDTWYSQAVPHPSTNQAQRCLTSQIGRDAVCSTWYGRRRGACPKSPSYSTRAPTANAEHGTRARSAHLPRFSTQPHRVSLTTTNVPSGSYAAALAPLQIARKSFAFS